MLGQSAAFRLWAWLAPRYRLKHQYKAYRAGKHFESIYRAGHPKLGAKTRHDALNCCFVAATLVYSYLLWHILQVDGTHARCAVPQLHLAWVSVRLQMVFDRWVNFLEERLAH